MLVLIFIRGVTLPGSEAPPRAPPRCLSGDYLASSLPGIRYVSRR